MKSFKRSYPGWIFALSVLILCATSFAFAASTSIVSIATDGTQGNATSNQSVISPEGNLIAFLSTSDNLIPGFMGTTNYIYDRSTNTIEPLCESIYGGNPSSPCYDPSFSVDGNIVVFYSYATDLIPNDPDVDQAASLDIFLRDRQNGTIEKVGRGSTPSISGDGRYIAFNRHYGSYCIDVIDRVSGIITQIDVDDAGAPGTGSPYGSSFPEISEDGRFVAFKSSYTNLAPEGDTNGIPDIFLHDRDADGDGIFDEPGAISTIRVSVDSNGQEGTSFSSDPSISADGNFVIFRTPNALVANDINGQDDTYIYDRVAGQILCASVDMDGIPSGSAGNASISRNGIYVAYASGDILPEDTNLSADIYIFNRITGDVEIASLDDQGNLANGPNESSGMPKLSNNGQFVSFHSWAPLVYPDVNGTADVFVRDRISQEVKHDGIDQDYNGYDLTIEINKATHKSNKDILYVEATSTLGTSAVLALDGYGPMVYSGNKWSITVEPAGGNPGTITVSGIEGSETAAVTSQ